MSETVTLDIALTQCSTIYISLYEITIFFIRERSQALDSNSTDKIGIGKAVIFFYFIS